MMSSSGWRRWEINAEYLQWEVLLGRMWKIPLTALPRGVHYTPVWIIPKRNKPGKWRLIVDLSSQGMSINNSIDTDRSSLSYASVDHLAALVVSTARYRLFLSKNKHKGSLQDGVSTPTESHLLGVQCESAVYITKMLPFGLRSTPKIFAAVADAVQWILYSDGI